jgi:hypothetical protein
MQRINIGFYNPKSLEVTIRKNKVGEKSDIENNSPLTTPEVTPTQVNDPSVHEGKEETLNKRSLILEIRGFPKKAKQNQALILDNLSIYRLKIAGIKHKAIHIDQEIWSTYHAINREIPKIIAQTRKLPLALCSKSRLQSLHSNWLSIIQQQETLLLNLAKAPNSVEFYNKMLLRQGFRAKERSVLLVNKQKITCQTFY